MSGKGKALLIVGIIICIIGIAGFIYVSSVVKDYQSGWGQLARGLDEQSQSQYQALQGVKVVSIILIVLGLVFIGIEVVIYLKKPSMPIVVMGGNQMGIGMRLCPKCSSPIPGEQRFCTSCGTDVFTGG